MFNYLQDVEEMISDTAIGQIKKMKDISDHRCTDHIYNYESITKDMTSLSDQAVFEMNALAQLGVKGSLKIAEQADLDNQAYQQELAIIKEEPQ